MANYGFSFAPTAGNTMRGTQAPTSRPQEAVGFRSLTLPRQDVPNRIAAPSLTGAPGAIGMPSADLLRLLMQMLGGQGQRSMAAPVAPPSGAPQGLRPQGYAPQAAPVMQGPSMRPLSNTAPHLTFLKADPRDPPSLGTPGASSGADPNVQPSGGSGRGADRSVPSTPGGGFYTGPANTVYDNGAIATPVSRSPTPSPSYTPPNLGGFDFAREFGSWLG